MRFKNSLENVFRPIAGLALIASTYVLGAGLIGLAGDFYRGSFKEENVENHLTIEKKKLGIEEYNIEVDFSGNYQTSRAGSLKVGDNNYLIAFGPKDRGINTLRHELCHIALGHTEDDTPSILPYVLYYEPITELCATTGIKL